MRIEELTEQIERTGPRAGTTRVVAIDGPAGSGKTRLAARLALPLRAPVVHMDDLFPGWDGLDDGPRRLLEWVLEPLATGRAARYRRFDWVSDRYAEWVDVPGAGTLIVEGCGSGARSGAPYLSFLIWVEAPMATRMRRGIERDGETFRPHWNRWAEQELIHFAAEGTAARAHVRLDGAPTIAHDPELEVVPLR
ncbi:MAG TPA: uridine kinase [Jiangellaceae bacterium]|nr:uridine kinase [Jiangellaceae bacterium]